ncbi:MAG: DNA protecting protein DprA [Candidatus Sungbacteria bacterium RIFCSPHIGHO2_02_FULL_47_11]|uniref:DNA protecting protein DprA n=1 Tax=Candidatus Sungbacteria bacterium RIFCSPHIGHO2_02_FULL_47_11 TaxID=1802270 RepID=A0A1G2KG66_9BACT|nr:MAG: DNA protecting protein DprA [Candidatus Sungbacteria bacterium RIFCSPHIGHO2_02_FULL_47_11]
MTNDIKFLNAFNAIPGVGPATLRILKERFTTYEDAWRASDSALSAINLQQQAYLSITWKRPSINPDKEMGRLVKENIWMITEEDPSYPLLLKEIPNPPVTLYGKGNPLLTPLEMRNGAVQVSNKEVAEHLSPAISVLHKSLTGLTKTESKSILAVVGTRRPTSYGLEATEMLVQEIASLGLTIVSGLATGIDARAHAATLDAGGHTIAVLGSGVDQNSIFPSENRGLARRIEESGGAVISEYAPGTPAIKEHFPQRNRIISGLAQGTLVIEARERSGALITARFALEQNRDVFALPGSIFSPHAAGTHKLIQEGAKLITSVADILEGLGIDYTKKKEHIARESLTTNEQTILNLLEEPIGVDFLKEKTELATPTIIASLSMLELKGLIKNMEGDTYQKITNS